MKKIFFLLLIIPFFSFGEEEVTPFPAGRNTGADTAEPSAEMGHAKDGVTEGRATAEGLGSKVCDYCIKEIGLNSTAQNFTPGQKQNGSNDSETTNVKKGN